MNLIEVIIFAGQLVIAGIFLFAAGTKLIDRSGLRNTIIDFGLAQRSTKYLVYGIPILEVSFSVMLLTEFYAWWGAIGILLLLLSFLTAMIINITYRKARPPCHCFGEGHSQPIGTRTLIRNGILIGVTLFIVMQGPFAIQRTMSEVFAMMFSPYEFVLPPVIFVTIVLVVMTCICYQQTRRFRSKLEDSEQTESGLFSTYPRAKSYPRDGPAIGSRATNFTSVDTNGVTRTLHSFTKVGKPVLLFFTSPTCRPCNNLFPSISKWQKNHADEISIVIISRGALEENREKTIQYQLSNLLIEHDNEVSVSYDVYGTPAAILIYPDRSIGSSIAMGAEQISALVMKSVTHIDHYPKYIDEGEKEEEKQGILPVSTSSINIGAPIPSLRLLDINGKTVELAKLKGKKFAMIFWSPHCIFCEQLLESLKILKTSDEEQISMLILISSYEGSLSQFDGFLYPVVVDLSSEVQKLFGIKTTPAAVLIDEYGKIATTVRSGASAVLSLLGFDKQYKRKVIDSMISTNSLGRST